MLSLQDVYDRASCSDHPLTLSAEEIVGAQTIVAYGGCSCGSMNEDYDTCGSYCDSHSFAIGRVRDGRYVTIEEWSDSSGHGCRCGGTASFYNTLRDALVMGLGRENRETATSGMAWLAEVVGLEDANVG